jgi:hypothetical protein
MESLERFEREMTLEVFKQYLLKRIASQLNDVGCKRLQSIAKINLKSVSLFELYGCAIILSDAYYGVSSLPQVAVTMIALDPWVFSCSHRQSQNYVLTSKCSDFSTLPVATINANEVKEIFRKFNQLLESASKRHGHQKTPGFILSIIRQACDKSTTDSHSCPGFTDVGEHSGQVPRRNTRWSLVRSVTHFFLQTNFGKFAKVKLIWFVFHSC